MNSIDWFLFLVLVTSGATNDCVSISVKKSEVTNKKQSVKLKLNHPNYPNDPHLLIRFH